MESKKISIYNARTGAVEQVEKVIKSGAEWKKILTPEQYRVMRQKGTETPSTGQCELPEEGGLYRCAGCATDLFKAEKKFDSGTGWPSFFEPVSELNISTHTDQSHGMVRTEVQCARCDAHLGHVFDDGPPPIYKRYCINAVALKLEKNSVAAAETATFAAGCFWGVEEEFRTLPGVLSTEAGYTGGTSKNVTYQQVCGGQTGHAEAVRVVYDPSKISYEELLDVFWSHHDPTTRDRQGPDVGTQYRSAIFYYSPKQKAAAEMSKEKLGKSGRYKGSIVTEIAPAGTFCRAEEYHQHYLQKRGATSCH